MMMIMIVLSRMLMMIIEIRIMIRMLLDCDSFHYVNGLIMINLILWFPLCLIVIFMLIIIVIVLFPDMQNSWFKYWSYPKWNKISFTRWINRGRETTFSVNYALNELLIRKKLTSVLTDYYFYYLLCFKVLEGLMPNLPVTLETLAKEGTTSRPNCVSTTQIDKRFILSDERTHNIYKARDHPIFFYE